MESWLKPMLCSTSDVVLNGGNWQVEPKLDGWRFVTWNTGRGVLAYGGRDGSDYSGCVQYIEDALRELPKDTALDGELIHPALGWGGVQSAMTTQGPSPEDLVFVVFDVLRVAGVDARANPLSERREALEGLMQRILPNEHITYTPTIEHMDEPLKWALASGFEGVVCKRLDMPYQSGMRSPFWQKVKPQVTCEARIVGFKEGTGSRAGTPGAFEIELLENGARTRCKIQDTIHKDVTANESRWLGSLIEIKHHGLGKTGKPRHPQYLRRRDDLPQDTTGDACLECGQFAREEGHRAGCGTA
jgi:bifunctional non-homologous end joining protein LigD